MKRVYRIETPKHGFGLYSGDLELKLDFADICVRLGFDGHNTYHHPTPLGDPSLEWRKIKERNEHQAWSFGFSSVRQLLKWTINAAIRKEMNSIGYVVRIFECEDNNARYGKAQAIFIKDKARLVAEHPLTDFH